MSQSFRRLVEPTRRALRPRGRNAREVQCGERMLTQRGDAPNLDDLPLALFQPSAERPQEGAAAAASSADDVHADAGMHQIQRGGQALLPTDDHGTTPLPHADTPNRKLDLIPARRKSVFLWGSAARCPRRARIRMR